MKPSSKKNQLSITGVTSKRGADRAAYVLAWGKSIAMIICASGSIIITVLM